MTQDVPSAAAPLLRCTLRELPGYLLGFTQPAVQLRFTLQPVAESALTAAAAALDAVCGNDAATSATSAATSPAALIEHLLRTVQTLQRKAGIVLAPSLHLGSPQATGDDAGALRIEAALPVAQPQATRDALVVVLEATNQLLDESSAQTLAARLAAITTLCDELVAGLRQRHDEGQNTPYLLQAALDLQLPVSRLAPQVARLGWGARQRLFASTLTDHTLALGVRLARDKHACAQLLRHIGMPGAENAPAASADEAAALARRWGYPLVVKPRDRDGGLGVAADLRDEATLREAWAEARRHSAHVLVERHVEGRGHRLTVAAGRVIKATVKAPWGVTGDGVRTIAALVAEPPPPPSDAPPRSAAAPPDPTTLDAEALGLLHQQGLGAQSVLAAGHFVALRRRNNSVASGRSKRLDIATLHPHNLQLAIRAAEALRLDVAGVDLIVPDITRSWTTQPALICEVNAQPQSDPATLAAWLAESLGPGGVRVPVWLALLAERDGPAPEADVMSRWALALGADGWATTAQACVAGELLAGKPGDGWATAQAVLASQQVNAALLVLPLATVQRLGLPVDRLRGCWVAHDVSALQRVLPPSTPVPTKPQLLVASSPQPNARATAWLATAVGPHVGAL